MMATTHVLAGMALAAVVTLVAPDLGPVAVVSAAVGGLFPDLDLYAGHRKTLHYPVYYPLSAALAGALALAVPTLATTALAFFLLGATLHAAMDVFGGGLELKPWLGTSDRAVYDHFNGRWIAPKRWIRYDGSPEDLGLAAVFAVPAMVAFAPPVDRVVLGILAVSAAYALVRKPMASLAERLVSLLPTRVLIYVPDRFHEGTVPR